MAKREPVSTRPPRGLLEKAGFVQCALRKCNVWIDPVNLPDGRCTRHFNQ